MTLTKSDIDALVEAIPSCQTVSYGIGGPMKPCGLYNGRDLGNGDHVLDSRLRRAFYLAAGLTAEGERKPEKVRCMKVVNPEYPAFDHFWAEDTAKATVFPPGYKLTPGWFVPDGAEGEG